MCLHDGRFICINCPVSFLLYCNICLHTSTIRRGGREIESICDSCYDKQIFDKHYKVCECGVICKNKNFHTHKRKHKFILT
jgi:hypothetical protein